MSDLNYIIDFDLPYQFHKLDLFSIDGQRLIDIKKTEEIFQKNISTLDRCLDVVQNELKKNDNLYFWLTFSGVFLEQAQQFYPNLLKKLKIIINHKKVRLIGQNYYRSYALFYNQEIYTKQVKMTLDQYYQLFKIKTAYFLDIETYHPKLPNILKKLKVDSLISYFKFQDRKTDLINFQPIHSTLLSENIINPFFLFKFQNFQKTLQLNSSNLKKANSNNIKIDFNDISLLENKFNILQQACLKDLFVFTSKIKNEDDLIIWQKLQHYSHFQNINQNDKMGFENYRNYCFLLNQFKERILNG